MTSLTTSLSVSPDLSPTAEGTAKAGPPIAEDSSPQATWQQALKQAVRDPLELCRLVGLSAEYAEAACRAAHDFPVFAPRHWIARIRPGDPHDPLLRQVLPLAEELDSPGTYKADPVGDHLSRRRAGLLHKYNGRVLLVTTGACAIHCRYCFRKHYPYGESPKGLEAWEEALGQIATDRSLREVILSGGDPLMLVDDQLARLAERLSGIDHLRRLRVHTRLPIVLPERVTDELIGWLRAGRLSPVVVVHANHPAELDDVVGRALGRLVDAGIPLLNQSVLLRGVNDDVATLAELSERLVDMRVMPYYLHQLDRVLGAAHFEVAEERGLALVEQLRGRLPGYAVPRYVREDPQAPYKTVLVG